MASKKYEGTIRVDQYMAERPGVIQIIKGFNARTNLSNMEALEKDIEENGLKDALWVRPDPANKEQPFILIDGERRLTALNRIFARYEQEGKEWTQRIPLQIFYCDEEEAFDLMVTALMGREGLSPDDEASLVAKQLERGFSITQVAKKMSRSTAWVEQRKLYATLTKKVKQAVRDDKLTIVAALDMARKVPQAQQGDVLDAVMEVAKDKKSKARKALADRTGTLVRPGKKDLCAAMTRLNEQEVNGATVKAQDARRLVVEALRYGAGEVGIDTFIKTCVKVLIHTAAKSPEPPAVVVNNLEL